VLKSVRILGGKKILGEERGEEPENNLQGREKMLLSACPGKGSDSEILSGYGSKTAMRENRKKRRGRRLYF